MYIGCIGNRKEQEMNNEVIADAFQAQLEDDYNLRGLDVDISTYSTVIHVNRREQRVQITSFVFFTEEHHIRIDVCNDKIYLPGCGANKRDWVDISKRLEMPR